MLRSLAFALLLCAPLPALARCAGKDLITALPPVKQASLDAAAAAVDHPEGLLWQATRGATRITLFGTYHFQHERTADHLEALKPRIKAAEVVYLEVSNDDQDQLTQELAEDPSIMFITKGETLPDLLGEADWQRLAEEMRARAIPPFMAAKFKPFWAAMMLGIGPCEARAAAGKENGIDQRIGEFSESLGKPSRSLEDFRVLLTLFDRFPQEEQLDMIRLLFAWSGRADDLAYTLRQRYLAQETALIWEYSRMVSLETGDPGAAEDFDLFERQFLTGRNRDWVEVLLREADGIHAFVAVGAAHLPGSDGLLRLLERKGFAVTRLPFDG